MINFLMICFSVASILNGIAIYKIAKRLSELERYYWVHLNVAHKEK